MNSFIHLTIPARAEFIDIVRLTLFGIANKAGFSYEEIEDMKVAVTEACTNVVLHAYSNAQPGVIDLSFELEHNGITIRIKDEGSSFKYKPADSKAATLHDKELSEVTAGGLGLFMMHALMDKVEVFSERGTEVILTKLFGRKEEMA
ncbi:serine/threonine-protein kinase RsbW [Paenibacillus endophyticus]|uniref:Serine/threonine-protein kinase RsbW n=1 Tax=Paenibacillus endophyticus TaxID=1294268 RepID=A0A7W5C500_9BACL|nr:anti-sigma B factor RsbW [Paenibacillus endophyticus]MBB3150997.1 serine/threonine-protein kinase RsbW [Paenibacillus endophyticus]